MRYLIFVAALIVGCQTVEAEPAPKAESPVVLQSDTDAGLSKPVLAFTVSHIEEPVKLTGLEQKILEVALTCKRAKPKYKDAELLTDLILMEREFGVPKDMRGMLLASACTESGYNPNAEGDHKFSKRGKPKAIGLLQLWKWWEKPISKGGYAVNRRDPLANAHAWMSHIKKQYPKVRKKCKISTKHVSRIWRVAWVTAIRAPKPEGRCNEFPNHYRRLKRWKRQWANLL
tara:strand:+ start:477 stop:1166 length:690 start_codon:yes stop_codon:yes gene_type:complete